KAEWLDFFEELDESIKNEKVSRGEADTFLRNLAQDYDYIHWIYLKANETLIKHNLMSVEEAKDFISLFYHDHFDRRRLLDSFPAELAVNGHIAYVQLEQLDINYVETGFAIEALGRSHDPLASKFLVERSRKELSPKEKLDVAKALGDVGTSEAVERLEEMGKSENKNRNGSREQKNLLAAIIEGLGKNGAYEYIMSWNGDTEQDNYINLKRIQQLLQTEREDLDRFAIMLTEEAKGERKGRLENELMQTLVRRESLPIQAEIKEWAGRWEGEDVLRLISEFREADRRSSGLTDVLIGLSQRDYGFSDFISVDIIGLLARQDKEIAKKRLREWRKSEKSDRIRLAIFEALYEFGVEDVVEEVESLLPEFNKYSDEKYKAYKLLLKAGRTEFQDEVINLISQDEFLNIYGVEILIMMDTPETMNLLIEKEKEGKYGYFKYIEIEIREKINKYLSGRKEPAARQWLLEKEGTGDEENLILVEAYKKIGTSAAIEKMIGVILQTRTSDVHYKMVGHLLELPYAEIFKELIHIQYKDPSWGSLPKETWLWHDVLDFIVKNPADEAIDALIELSKIVEKKAEAVKKGEIAGVTIWDYNMEKLAAQYLGKTKNEKALQRLTEIKKSIHNAEAIANALVENGSPEAVEHLLRWLDRMVAVDRYDPIKRVVVKALGKTNSYRAVDGLYGTIFKNDKWSITETTVSIVNLMTPKFYDKIFQCLTDPSQWPNAYQYREKRRTLVPLLNAGKYRGAGNLARYVSGKNITDSQMDTYIEAVLDHDLRYIENYYERDSDGAIQKFKNIFGQFKKSPILLFHILALSQELTSHSFPEVYPLFKEAVEADYEGEFDVMQFIADNELDRYLPEFLFTIFLYGDLEDLLADTGLTHQEIVKNLLTPARINNFLVKPSMFSNIVAQIMKFENQNLKQAFIDRIVGEAQNDIRLYVMLKILNDFKAIDGELFEGVKKDLGFEIPGLNPVWKGPQDTWFKDNVLKVGVYQDTDNESERAHYTRFPKIFTGGRLEDKYLEAYYRNFGGYEDKSQGPKYKQELAKNGAEKILVKHFPRTGKTIEIYLFPGLEKIKNSPFPIISSRSHSGAYGNNNYGGINSGWRIASHCRSEDDKDPLLKANPDNYPTTVIGTANADATNTLFYYALEYLGGTKELETWDDVAEFVAPHMPEWIKMFSMPTKDVGSQVAATLELMKRQGLLPEKAEKQSYNINEVIERARTQWQNDSQQEEDVPSVESVEDAAMLGARYELSQRAGKLEQIMVTHQTMGAFGNFGMIPDELSRLAAILKIKPEQFGAAIVIPVLDALTDWGVGHGRLLSSDITIALLNGDNRKILMNPSHGYLGDGRKNGFIAIDADFEQIARVTPPEISRILTIIGLAREMRHELGIKQDNMAWDSGLAYQLIEGSGISVVDFSMAIKTFLPDSNFTRTFGELAYQIEMVRKSLGNNGQVIVNNNGSFRIVLPDTVDMQTSHLTGFSRFAGVTVQKDSNAGLNSPEDLGGIDFGKVDLQREGDGSNLEFNFENPRQLEMLIDAEGLSPVIYTISPLPVQSLPMFLNISEADKREKSLAISKRL
ncbi:MAG: HEAT repeat domain-containing protein, partial [Candidatus Omnitrophica bacterium]|nr:HEAT repeat domain-containing protein [Candidatus Omnitrophota bacterium]